MNQGNHNNHIQGQMSVELEENYETEYFKREFSTQQIKSMIANPNKKGNE